MSGRVRAGSVRAHGIYSSCSYLECMLAFTVHACWYLQLLLVFTMGICRVTTMLGGRSTVSRYGADMGQITDKELT